MLNIALIGLGHMGRAIAVHLAETGACKVSAWNRSGVTLDGVAVLGDPVDAFDADVVITMLSDDDAIRAALLDSGALEKAGKSAIHIVMSTISTGFAAELTGLHARLGLEFLMAPVFGRPDVAAAGKLNIIAAGDAAVIARARPVLDLIGQKTYVVGERPEMASAVKLSGNAMLVNAVEAMAEAAAISETHGVSRAAFLDIMLNTLFSAPVYKGYGAKIISGDDSVGFTLTLAAKDIRLALAAAGSDADVPLIALLRDRIAQGIDEGRGNEDLAALSKVSLRG
ncbi:NAD(P)-dependent oxidoreductase [Martelella sp. HB161492]|uniref:NAD(P)-dependent oxidoreductase n=1 Tax=Martelella sp. HB161492 TaxID=2720726 RepID=UPI0015909C4E|nr:NAD(P)-dependent oxidoreductase [Martelella sp. HB161492]